MCVISRRTRGQPLDIRYAEIGLERLLNLLPPKPGIAHLDLGIEIALLRGQQRAAPVDLNATALNHEVFTVALCLKQPLAEQPGRGLRHAAVLLPILMLGPRIEVEMHNGNLPLRGAVPLTLPSDFGFRISDFASRPSLHKDRPGITRPAAVGGMMDELDAGQFSPGARENAASNLLVGLAVHQQAHALARDNLADDLPIDPADRLYLIRPVDGIVRPDQPGRFVALPFRRHGEAECGGRQGRRFGSVPPERRGLGHAGKRGGLPSDAPGRFWIGAGAFLDLAGNGHGIAILCYDDKASLPRNRPFCKGKLGQIRLNIRAGCPVCDILPRPWDRRHGATPHPSPLPFGRGEGEALAALGVV